MKKMTSHERFKRMFEHRPADRIPVIDIPWTATIERWHQEGMSKDASYVDFFGLDKVEGISVDNSPRYETRTIEETDEYVIGTTPWGVTVKNWKRAASTPQFLDFTINSPDRWQEAKKRMVPTADRIDWKYLENNYRKWRRDGCWIEGGLFFGFDVTHSCGDINPFVPELVEIGLDGLNPIEVKAGMNPAALKKQYGGKLLLHGGINAVLWNDPEAIEAEMRRVLPVVKESGGYIFSSDHSVPSSVGLENFRRVVELVKKLGKYD